MSPSTARSAPPDIASLGERLQRYLRAECGDVSTVEDVRVMEAGHAGLTFGFDLVGPGPSHRRGLVLKVAPAGVRRAGNTDVHRQAPLLRALHAGGLAVPDVPFASADDAWLGAPFIVMERLAGEPFFVWEPSPAFDRADAAVGPLWEQTIDAMVGLHRFDWQAHLANWEAPRPLAAELGYWEPVLLKAPEASWIASGRALRDRLAAILPANAPIGLVHGDCQPGNGLFAQGRLTGLIDWELASIGARWLDVGWMMMLADRAAWPQDWRPHCPLAPRQIAERYGAAMNEPVDALPWFQAFAGYRLGAIACLNVHLHRSGRRPDATWERFAGAVPQLFARSAEVLTNHPLPSENYR